jgi:hypothetical protein
MNHASRRFSTTDSVDAEYCFSRPTVYLAPHELARLTILRSRPGDTRAERIAHAPSSHIPPELPSASRRPIR